MHIHHTTATKPLRVRQQPANVVGRFNRMCHRNVKTFKQDAVYRHPLEPLYHADAGEKRGKRRFQGEEVTGQGTLEEHLLLLGLCQLALQFLYTFL